MPGRKKKYTAKEMAEAIRECGGVIKDAAQTLGCDRSTIYRYADEYKTVEQAIENSRPPLVREARGRLADLMRDPEHKDHYKALMKILEVHDDRYDWSDRERKEISGDAFDITIVPPDDD